MRPRLEVVIEWVLYASRWILAPMYLGLTLMLVGILFVFLHDLAMEITHVWSMDGKKIILLALSLIDLSLMANLVLIVIFAGYENFVSRLHIDDHEDRPGWMGTVDFSGLKIKLIASIVAISAIELLRVYMPLGDSGAQVDGTQLRWMITVHLTFVLSGVLLAIMDWINASAKAHGAKD